jgi:hypothetical protein
MTSKLPVYPLPVFEPVSNPSDSGVVQQVFKESTRSRIPLFKTLFGVLLFSKYIDIPALVSR